MSKIFENSVGGTSRTTDGSTITLTSVIGNSSTFNPGAVFEFGIGDTVSSSTIGAFNGDKVYIANPPTDPNALQSGFASVQGDFTAATQDVIDFSRFIEQGWTIVNETADDVTEWGFTGSTQWSKPGFPIVVINYNFISGFITGTTPPPAGNNAPDANDDGGNSTQLGTAITLDVLANDSDPDGDPLTIVGTSFRGTPGNGQISVQNNQVVYTPAAGDENRTIEINYTIDDGRGGQDTATAFVFVSPGATPPPPPPPPPANNPPEFTNVSNGQRIFIDENQNFVVDTDAFDLDGDNLTFSISPSNAPQNADAGRFTIDPNTGVLSFINAPDFEAQDSAIGNDAIYDVIVRVEDGRGGVDEVALLVDVRDVDDTLPPPPPPPPPPAGNNAPDARDDGGNRTQLGTPITVNVLANDSDPDGDPLTIVGTSFRGTPGNGQISVQNNQLVYNPGAGDENRTIEINYTIDDGRGGQDTATAFVFVSPGATPPPPPPPPPANNPPEFTNVTNGQRIVIEENQNFVVDTDAFDLDGDNLTFSISPSNAPRNSDAGRFTIDPNTGVLSFIDAPDFEAQDSARGGDAVYDVIVRVEDGRGGVDEVALLVDVRDVDETPPPPPPPAPTGPVDDFITVTESEDAGDVDGNVLDNDNLGPLGQVITVNGVSGNVGQWIDLPDGGRVLVNADGTIDFDANGDFEDLNDGEFRDVTLEYSVPNPAAAPVGQITVQAETFDTNGFKGFSLHGPLPHAEGKLALGGDPFKNDTGATATLNNFEGGTGTYDVTFSVQDNNIGQITYELLIDGQSAGTFRTDVDAQDSFDPIRDAFSDITISDVDITQGAQVQFRIIDDQGFETGIVDTVTFTPTSVQGPGTFTLEAEVFEGNGFELFWDNKASGNHSMSDFTFRDKGGELTLPSFEGQSGVYDLTWKVRGDTFGETFYDVLINGQVAGSFSTDGDTSRRAEYNDYTLSGLQLQTGDELAIRVADKTGVEYAIIDSVTFAPTTFVPATDGSDSATVTVRVLGETDGSALSGTVTTEAPGTQSLTFIIDHSFDMFRATATGADPDANGDLRIRVIDAVLNRIVEETAGLDASQPVNFILIGDEEVRGQTTLTAADIQAADAAGDLPSIFQTAFAQPDGSEVNTGLDFRAVNLKLALQEAKTYITDTTLGFDAATGADQDNIVVITASDGTVGIDPVTGESLALDDFTTIRDELLDDAGIDAEIDVVTVNTGIRLDEIDASFDFDPVVIDPGNTFDPLLLVELDSDGVVTNVGDADAFGLADLTENTTLVDTGKVLSVFAGGQEFTVASGDLVDTNPADAVFEFELSGIDNFDPGQVFLGVDRDGDGVQDLVAAQVPEASIIETAPDSFEFAFTLESDGGVFGG